MLFEADYAKNYASIMYQCLSLHYTTWHQELSLHWNIGSIIFKKRSKAPRNRLQFQPFRPQGRFRAAPIALIDPKKPVLRTKRSLSLQNLHVHWCMQGSDLSLALLTRHAVTTNRTQIFTANIFVSPHQQTVLQSTTFRPGCPSHFQVSNRKRKCQPF